MDPCVRAAPATIQNVVNGNRQVIYYSTVVYPHVGYTSLTANRPFPTPARNPPPYHGPNDGNDPEKPASSVPSMPNAFYSPYLGPEIHYPNIAQNNGDVNTDIRDQQVLEDPADLVSNDNRIGDSGYAPAFPLHAQPRLSAFDTSPSTNWQNYAPDSLLARTPLPQGTYYNIYSTGPMMPVNGGPAPGLHPTVNRSTYNDEMTFSVPPAPPPSPQPAPPTKRGRGRPRGTGKATQPRTKASHTKKGKVNSEQTPTHQAAREVGEPTAMSPPQTQARVTSDGSIATNTYFSQQAAIVMNHPSLAPPAEKNDQYHCFPPTLSAPFAGADCAFVMPSALENTFTPHLEPSTGSNCYKQSDSYGLATPASTPGNEGPPLTPLEVDLEFNSFAATGSKGSTVLIQNKQCYDKHPKSCTCTFHASLNATLPLVLQKGISQARYERYHYCIYLLTEDKLLKTFDATGLRTGENIRRKEPQAYSKFLECAVNHLAKKWIGTLTDKAIERIETYSKDAEHTLTNIPHETPTEYLSVGETNFKDGSHVTELGELTEHGELGCLYPELEDACLKYPFNFHIPSFDDFLLDQVPVTDPLPSCAALEGGESAVGYQTIIE